MDSFLSYHAETRKHTHTQPHAQTLTKYSIVTITTNTNILFLNLSNISRATLISQNLGSFGVPFSLMAKALFKITTLVTMNPFD